MRHLYLASTVLAVIGLGLSLYLTYVSSLPYCPLPAPGCDQVIASPYSKILGVPVAALGAAWFTVAAALSLTAALRGRCGRALLSWCVVGVLGVAYLIYLEVAVIGAVCLYCTLAHLLGLGVTGLAAAATLPRPRG